ncbi:MAG: NAD(P)/FAD-dependent oxidoreductase [Actinomycetota bacterium]
MKQTADVVVVGGGIIGCSTAAELAGAGAAVVLVERREIAHGASGRNHGLIFYPQNPLTDPVYRASHGMYKALADEGTMNLQLDEHPVGFIILAAEESDWAAAEAEAMACKVGGVEVHRLDRRELTEAEPNLNEDLLGGWRIDDGYRLDPAALTLAFALMARLAGAEINTHTEVKQILVKAGRVRGVATDQGIIDAPVVVDAAGPWAPKVARSAGLDLAVLGARGWLLLTRPIEPMCSHLVESAGWHLLADDPGPSEITVGDYSSAEQGPKLDIGMLIQQNAGGNVLLGGSRAITLTEAPDGHEVARAIAASAVKALPDLAGVPLAAVWSGVRPMTADGLPFIGWLPGIEGFFAASGHGGQGIILGGGSGRLCAQMIMGAETFTDPTPFRLDRGAP